MNALEIILKAMKVPFEKNEREISPYSKEFVAKIKKSKKNFAEGKYKTVKIEDLWK